MLRIDPDDIGDMACDVGRRLKLSRLAMGMCDQKQFGEDAGLQQSLYNRFESGKRLLTLQSAMQLCHHYLDALFKTPRTVDGITLTVVATTARKFVVRFS